MMLEVSSVKIGSPISGCRDLVAAALALLGCLAILILLCGELAEAGGFFAALLCLAILIFLSGELRTKSWTPKRRCLNNKGDGLLGQPLRLELDRAELA